MAALGDDCYFFCTSTCAKGAACPFRHVESAKTCRIICQHWQMGACLRPMCKFRHSDFVIQLDTSEVPCYWETQPTGCVKKNCMYKHLKPRLLNDVAPPAVPVSTSVATTVTTATSINDVNTSHTFVQPVVKPVIIQNIVESEESNSSPVKKQTESQEVKVETLQMVEQKKSEQEESENDVTQDDKVSHTTTEQPVIKKAKKVAPVVNKVKKAPVQKSPKKKIEKIKSKKSNQPKKSVKQRLGKVPSPEPASQSSSEESDSESDSDTDDSIENIKVMSMEEILRQKALESMRSKKATEGRLSTDKKLLSATGRKMINKQEKLKKPAKKFEKPVSRVKLVKRVKSPVESSSPSSAESSDENDTSRQSSEKSSNSSFDSSSDSSDSEVDSGEDSKDLDIRRVVVDHESEKAARKRAKASLLEKQKLSVKGSKSAAQVSRVAARNHMPLRALNKINNRKKQHSMRRIDIDYDSDDLVSSRVKEPLKLVSVRDRLGKNSTTLHKAHSDARLMSRVEKYEPTPDSDKTTAAARKRSLVVLSKKSESSGSSDDRDSLADVKVKTLEEIKLEKMKKQLASKEPRKSPEQDTEIETHKPVPITERLGKIQPSNTDSEDTKGRQVVLVNDSGDKSDDASNMKSDELKKTKKRPWRSLKRNVDISPTEVGSGERTAIIVSSPAKRNDYDADLKNYQAEQNVGESPFERFKRKTLMKKLESQILKQADLLDKGGSVKASLESLKKVEVREETPTEVKTHKHKHKHHHKKTKIERQIYMPPAMKNTAPEQIQVSEPVIPIKELFTAPTANVSPIKRGPHPIAAAWTAGLALSSKGVVARRPELTVNTLTPVANPEIVRKSEINNRFGIKEIKIAKPKEVIESSQSSVATSGVKIKSFSEIMAEKRKRRMELLAQKSGTTDTASTVSTTASSQLNSAQLSAAVPNAPFIDSVDNIKNMEAKPRVPISPIVFASSKPSNTSIKPDSSTSFMMGITSQPATVKTREITLPNSTNIVTDQTKSNFHNNSKIKADKKKNSKKKLFARKNYKDDSLISQENNSAITLLHPSGSVISSSTSSDNPSFQSNQSSKTSSDSPSSHQKLLDNQSSVSQPPHNSASTSKQNSTTKPPTKKETAAVSSSKKHSVPAPIIDAESSKKKARLSVEDEFNFFEDEDLGFNDSIIADDVEPIDNLLQDIDDLLS